jgi:hypothetical protein
MKKRLDDGRQTVSQIYEELSFPNLILNSARDGTKNRSCSFGYAFHDPDKRMGCSNAYEKLGYQGIDHFTRHVIEHGYKSQGIDISAQFGSVFCFNAFHLAFSTPA